MTTLDRLDGWKAIGTISEEQHALLTALVRRERFSVFVELNALLYIGVLSVVGGLGWVFRDYVTNLGDAAILGILTLLVVLSFGYCFTRTRPYSNEEVDAPTFIFDYVLYFGCLMFSATLAFIETRFGLFQGWNTQLLIAAVVFGLLAYRFDNRFVLSLALSTLAGYLGLRLSAFDDMDNDRLRLLAIMYGAFLLGVGGLLHRQGIKRHFLDVFLQLGANAILLATAFGALDGPSRGPYLVALLVLAASAIYLGVRYRRFAFVAYGTVYAYGVVSIRMLSVVGGAITGLLYFIVTGTAVVIALVVLARRFGRDE